MLYLMFVNVFTVYTLWICPDLLPCASTWPAVLAKLQGGADLMLPGVVLTTEESNLKEVQEGQLCSVNVVGNRYMQNIRCAHSNYPYSQ